MGIDILFLVISLSIILAGAQFFTNGIEWLGSKLRLSEGAVGSILAAVGTALPETTIPVIAILFGSHGAGEEIGIGAILGAPFMLGTLAFFITGLAVVLNRKKRGTYPKMVVDTSLMSRDLFFFLIVYSVAILSAFLWLHSLKVVVAIGLFIAYIAYVILTLKGEHDITEGHDLTPLYFNKKAKSPHLYIILVQILFALAAIVVGAKLFVSKVELIAAVFGVPSFVLALIIAPVATELPEKFNSVIWINQGKDTLALGNITGAMVFQSSVIPALGIALTEWNLSTGALLSAVLAVASAGMVYFQIKTKGYLTPAILMVGGGFYLIFVLMVFFGLIR